MLTMPIVYTIFADFFSANRLILVLWLLIAGANMELRWSHNLVTVCDRAGGMDKRDVTFEV